MWRTTGPAHTEFERQVITKRAKNKQEAMASSARASRIFPESGDEEDDEDHDIAGWQSAHLILGQLVDSYKVSIGPSFRSRTPACPSVLILPG
eukprot:6625859-Prymnesium_polylepis.1